MANETLYPFGNNGSLPGGTIIINDCITGGADKVLAAQQGVVLQGEIDTINNGLEVFKYSKLDTKPGVNLYDENARSLAKLSASGVPSANTSWITSDYILVDGNTAYCLHKKSGSALLGSSYICFYDVTKTFISSISNDTITFTTPANCRFVRFGTTKADDVQVQMELGSTPSQYEPYDAVYGYVGQMRKDVANRVVIDCGHNLFDKDNVSLGFIASAGQLSANNSFRASDYIPVDAGDSYHISQMGGAAVYTGTSPVYYAFYGIGLKFISSALMDGVKDVTAPSGAVYLRFSLSPSATDVMVEKGSTRSADYEVYSQIAGYVPIIRNKQVEERHLSTALAEKVNNRSSFARMNDSDTLAVGSTLKLDVCHIRKNTLQVARISGTVGNVAVGVGLPDGDYGSCYVEVEQSKVFLYQKNNPTPTKLNEYNHGLTLTTDTTVEIDTVLNGTSVTTTLRLYDGTGGVFEQVLSTWQGGRPFVKNNNDSDSVDVELSFFPRDLRARVWLFGDSYVNLVSDDRWPYYLVQKGMANWLVNSLAGQSGNNAISDLESVLALGAIPTYLVWTLGMNGGDDTLVDDAYVINSGQKSVIDSIVALCSTYGITPILSTVPTVPSRQRTGFCNYVKSLGVRYIDFADAVGADSDGVWKTGLLSNDGVHPTSSGAKVLATRALLDATELSIVLQ